MYSNVSYVNKHFTFLEDKDGNEESPIKVYTLEQEDNAQYLMAANTANTDIVKKV